MVYHSPDSPFLVTEPRTVLATMRFRGPAGCEREAAESWAFELTYYFLRGVGEAPRVSFENGVYTCTGLMTTTHPWDRGEHVMFSQGEAFSLSFCTDPVRREYLRTLYAHSKLPRFDGRPEHAAE